MAKKSVKKIQQKNLFKSLVIALILIIVLVCAVNLVQKSQENRSNAAGRTIMVEPSRPVVPTLKPVMPPTSKPANRITNPANYKARPVVPTLKPVVPTTSAIKR